MLSLQGGKKFSEHPPCPSFPMVATPPLPRRGGTSSKSRRGGLSSATSKRRKRRNGRAGKATASGAGGGGDDGGGRGGSKPAGRTDALHKVLQKQLRKRAGGKGKGENDDLEDVSASFLLDIVLCVSFCVE